MKRNLFAYIGLPVCAAVFLVFGIWVLAVWQDAGYIAGDIFLILFAVFALLVLTKIILQDNLNIKCGTLCENKQYAEEKALIEKKMKSPFFFLVRTVAFLRYIRVNMALDDLATAQRYIDSLRHGGGAGWKYMTAYFYILIKLDEGDRETALAEFEDFRTQCGQTKLYQEQIGVLTAIFHRLLNTGNNEPLPPAAVSSPFPVVGRVLGRSYEERFSGDPQWE